MLQKTSNKRALDFNALYVFFISILFFWYLVVWSSPVYAQNSYTNRQVDRAVEKFVTQWSRKDRIVILRKIQSVLPAAQKRLAWNATASTILRQINTKLTEKLSIIKWESDEFWLKRFYLDTKTNIRTIPLSEVVSWWPPKDWIPSLSNPAFISLSEAKERDYISPDIQWISIDLGFEVKFYPYNILNRHEIVNDIVWWKHIAVTFCPLCWTAIAFDRTVDWEIVTFWVSWKLYNSNLLMYDSRSETLWSQALWRWVIGTYTDYDLTYIPSAVLSFQEFSEIHPTWLILSNETGYERDYTVENPYGDYNNNDELYFPVTNIDPSLPKKELLYVVHDTDHLVSLWFVAQQLREVKKASMFVEWRNYVANFNNGKVTVERDWETLHTFTQMRFSRTAHDYYPRFLWQASE